MAFFLPPLLDRPATPILALAPRLGAGRALSFVWVFDPRVAGEPRDVHGEAIRLAEWSALDHGLAGNADLIVATYGAPVVANPLANLMHIDPVAGRGRTPRQRDGRSVNPT